MQRNEIVQYVCFSSMMIHLLMKQKRTLRLSQDWCGLRVVTSITVYVFLSGWRSIGHVLSVDKSCLLYDCCTIFVFSFYFVSLQQLFFSKAFMDSIIKACTSLSLLILLIAINFTNNSPQEAEAGYSDFVGSTLVATVIQLICTSFLFCLVIALQPSSLTPQ